MKWIRTETGKLVNLAHMSEVNIQSNRRTVDGSEVQSYTLRAYEPSYGDVPCSADLMRYDTKREAEQALADLFDWLSEDPVGCDFSAAKAGA